MSNSYWWNWICKPPWSISARAERMSGKSQYGMVYMLVQLQHSGTDCYFRKYWQKALTVISKQYSLCQNTALYSLPIARNFAFLISASLVHSTAFFLQWIQSYAKGRVLNTEWVFYWRDLMTWVLPCYDIHGWLGIQYQVTSKYCPGAVCMKSK